MELTKVWKPGCYQTRYKLEDNWSDVFGVLREVDFELGFVNEIHPAIEWKSRENDFFPPHCPGFRKFASHTLFKNVGI